LTKFQLQDLSKITMSNGSQESLINRLESSLEKLERKKWLLFLSFLTLYFTGFCLIAAKAHVTNDELYTIYIARLPSLQAVWKGLATGVEQTPPLIHLITRADFALLGTSPLSVRLPEMLGFLVMCVCLFHFVSKRSSAFYGFIAMLFPLMTHAFVYVFFARAYALVLGFSALALLCWDWAIENRHRMLALVGLWASLAAGVSSHYYAVLSLFPLGLGELVRTIRRKKIDVGVWLAFGLSLFPLLLFFPLIESARKFAPHFWAKPHWSSMAYYYPLFLLFKSTVPLLAIFLVVAIYTAFLRPNAWAGPPRARLCIPFYEWAMILGFLLIPAVGVVLSKTVVGAYSDRCALSAVIGLSIAIALGLYSALDTRLTPALCLGLLLCAFLMVKQVYTYRRVATERSEDESTYTFLETRKRRCADCDC
jgi:Dolichyl-phosphate-mannose-protein mannosyltransferase